MSTGNPYPRYAAIDIGSNAIRLQISRVTSQDHGEHHIKKLEYIRFPLRLGHDVFTLGRISFAKKEKFIKLMKVFKDLIDLFEVDEYIGCATSAMRNSENGQEILDEVFANCGLKIHTIDGDTEANIVNHAIFKLIDEGAYIHIDVGGGSTELNIYLNKRKTASKSFPVGTVRLMEHGNEAFRSTFLKMKEWIESQGNKIGGKLKAIGTGGNIVKLYELSESHKSLSVSLDQLEKVRAKVASYSYEDRITVLKLNPDRADVILPASDIYIKSLKWAKSKSIKVPDLGLKDGLISYLYLKSKGKPPFTINDI